jgi:signal transduction histidine kinase
MLCSDRLVGVVAIAQADKSERAYNWDDVRLLSAFAFFIGLIVDTVNSNTIAKTERDKRKRAERELANAVSKIKTLSAKIEIIREEERKQLARQIHDELGQLLTGVRLDLSWLAKNQQAILEKSQSLLELSDKTIESVQSISTELRPGALDELGLVHALEWQAKDFQERYGIECTTNLDIDEDVLDHDVATALFRVFQEALTNIARHAHASQVDVDLLQDEEEVVFMVHDNGVGIEENQVKNVKSLGLVGMRERAQAFGGTLEISGGPNLGTTVTARFPISSTALEETTMEEERT